eukprot:scaffold37414_cov29-Tisochrysis_lutea.AAC.3
MAPQFPRSISRAFPPPSHGSATRSACPLGSPRCKAPVPHPAHSSVCGFVFSKHTTFQTRALTRSNGNRCMGAPSRNELTVRP